MIETTVTGNGAGEHCSEGTMHQQPFDVQAEESGRVNAPAATAYRLIADYTTHHPAILPPAITNLTVEQGGYGEGTVISFDVRLGGRSRRMRARISEPSEGVLLETDLDTGGVTTFIVTPDGDASRVTIRTEFTSAAGLTGWIERRFAPGMLRKLYRQELANLDTYARQQGDAAAPLNDPAPVTG
ncbi:MAG TPA: SRPBCC family protein [Thermomicrobiales bacterium]|nr:SRPBCC family protein [Thermomicrobiales bacterium]